MNKFILDANAFIEPYRQYYPFDLAPGFWKQMGEALLRENVIVIDIVYNEVTRVEDELSTWLKTVPFQKVSVKDAQIINNYRNVLSYVQTCGYYKDSALRAWSESRAADPWLIARAMIDGAFIITKEAAKVTLSKNTPSKAAKIPNVAENFDVKCETLFYFMREMSFKL